MAVYWPPSLSADEINAELQGVPADMRPDIIVGDINAKYGTTWGIKATSEPERRACIANHCARWNLTHTRPSSGISAVDHVFSRPAVLTEWHYVPCPDAHTQHHKFMHLKVSTSDNINNNTSLRTPVVRISLKHLKVPLAGACLRIIITQRIQPAMRRVVEAETALLSVTRSDVLQQRIDAADSAITDLVTSAARDTLGTYDVDSAKMKTDNILDEMEEETMTMSKAIRLFKRAQRANGVITMKSRDPEKTAVDDAADFYQAIYDSINEPQPPPPTHIQPWPVNELSACFKEDAIEQFFKQYEPAKSCGADGLHTLLMRAVMATDVRLLVSKLFIVCCRTGLTPTRWNHSATFPIPKKKTAEFVTEFRPIALTSIMRRCFEAILHRATSSLGQLFGTSLKLNFSQGGFQRAQSCIQLILSSNDQHQVQGRGAQIFIDFKQAYDRVNIALLLTKLANRNPPPQFYALIRSLFTGCRTTLHVNQVQSRDIHLKTGLFQGSLLSPLLWNIYVDDLLDKLNGRVASDVPRARAFADDVKLQYHINAEPVEMQRDLDWVSAWTQPNNMIASIAKCGIIWPKKCPPNDGLETTVDTRDSHNTMSSDMDCDTNKEKMARATAGGGGSPTGVKRIAATRPTPEKNNDKNTPAEAATAPPTRSPPSGNEWELEDTHAYDLDEEDALEYLIEPTLPSSITNLSYATTDTTCDMNEEKMARTTASGGGSPTGVKRIAATRPTPEKNNDKNIPAEAATALSTRIDETGARHGKGPAIDTDPSGLTTTDDIQHSHNPHSDNDTPDKNEKTARPNVRGVGSLTDEKRIAARPSTSRSEAREEQEKNDETEAATVQENPVLLLCDQVLPVVVSYKYLGVENDSAGVDLDAYVKRTMTRAMALLGGISDQSQHWRPSFKLAIYRAFVRPIVEYAGPIIWAFIQWRGGDKQLCQWILSEFNRLHCAALNWIYDGRIQHADGRTVEASLASLAAPEDRLSDVAAMCQHHLDSAPLETPTGHQRVDIRIRPVYYPASLQKPILMHHRRREYNERYGDVQDKPDYKEFVKQQRRQTFVNGTYQKRAQYVPLNNRTPAGMDRVLDIAKDAIRKKALRWRRNRFHQTFKCRECHEQFHRGHCHDHLLVEVVPNDEWKALEMATKADPLNLRDMTILDSLLNRRKYDIFARAYDRLVESA
jgi:hypothetical protein